MSDSLPCGCSKAGPCGKHGPAPDGQELREALRDHAYMYSVTDQRAKCSCGWSGITPATFSTAWYDYVEHIGARFQPAPPQVTLTGDTSKWEARELSQSATAPPLHGLPEGIECERVC